MKNGYKGMHPRMREKWNICINLIESNLIARLNRETIQTSRLRSRKA